MPRRIKNTAKRRRRSPKLSATFVSDRPARKKAERRKRRLRHPSDPNLEKALRYLRAGNSQRLAAKSAGVSVQRFRQFIRKHKLARFKGRRWHFTDKRRRQIVAITTAGERKLVVRGFEPASWAMSHRNAVRQFADTNDVSLLAPFINYSFKDIHGRTYVLETRPNALYRQLSAGGGHYEQIYRLVT